MIMMNDDNSNKFVFTNFSFLLYYFSCLLVFKKKKKNLTFSFFYIILFMFNVNKLNFMSVYIQVVLYS